jgi:hypothetical protein
MRNDMKKVFTIVMTGALCLSLLVVEASFANAQTAATAGCAPGAMYSTTSGAPCPGTTASMGVTGTSGMTASGAGCAPGNTFNTQTGQACATMPGSASVAGCLPGYTYNTQTGAICPMTSTGGMTPGFPNTGFMPTSNIALLAASTIALGLGAIYLTKRALSY